MNVIEKIDSHTPSDVLPVQSSFKHGAAADWRSVCAPLFSVSPLSAPAMLRQSTARTWAVGPCLICQATVGGQILQRTLEHVSMVNRFVVLTRYIDGHIAGSTEGVPFGARTGSIVLRDFAHRFEALQYPSTIDVVVIPYRVLGVQAGDLPALRVVKASAQDCAPLQAALSETLHCLLGVSDGLSLRVLDQLLACTKSILTAPEHQQSVRQAARLAQRVAIDRFIDDNLERLDLSAETILPEFGVSRATLYRLFEDEGGVRKHIVDRRLFHAILEILEGGKQRGRIQRAAKRWGFSSAANFNRSVRQAFGGTPGSLFSASMTASAAGVRDSAPVDLGQPGWVSLRS